MSPPRGRFADVNKKSTALDRLIHKFCTDGYGSSQIAVADRVDVPSASGYSLTNQVAHLRARERFEEILHSLPTMSYAERQELNEVWRPTGEGSYGGVGGRVPVLTTINRASQAEWPRLRSQLAALSFGPDDIAGRLQTAMDEVDRLGPTSATRLVAICNPLRMIPNYSLHNTGYWPGKFICLQMLMDEALLDAEYMHRAEQVIRDNPRNKPSGHAIMASNDLLLDVLCSHFTNGKVVDTWGIRTFLYWLAEQYAAWGE